MSQTVTIRWLGSLAVRASTQWSWVRSPDPGLGWY